MTDLNIKKELEQVSLNILGQTEECSREVNKALAAMLQVSVAVTAKALDKILSDPEVLEALKAACLKRLASEDAP